MFGYNVLGFGGGGAADVPEGQQAFTSSGSHSWVAPDGVTSVCVVCVGAGGQNPSTNKGLGGGGLGYKNDISVNPGSSYTVVVGAQGNPGGDSYFINTSTVKGGGGSTVGGSYTGDGGGNGGDDGQNPGGGAGGYSGEGGNAAPNYGSGEAGQGGGGGGGSQFGAYDMVQGATGGGVGILGEGTSGGAGSGGSGGGDGAWDSSGTAVTGGAYGGGGGIWNHPAISVNLPGSVGAVRIIWGTGRAFPSTNTADV